MTETEDCEDYVPAAKNWISPYITNLEAALREQMSEEGELGVERVVQLGSTFYIDRCLAIEIYKRILVSMES